VQIIGSGNSNVSREFGQVKLPLTNQ